MKKILKKVGSGIVKSAHAVNKFSGGSALADYAGGKAAKAGLFTNKETKKYVRETTTKAQAVASAKKVAVTSAVIGSMGLGRVANVVVRGAKGTKIKHWKDYKGKGVDLTARRKGPKW